MMMMMVMMMLYKVHLYVYIYVCVCVLIACQQDCWTKIQFTRLVSTSCGKPAWRLTDGHCHAGNCSGKFTLLTDRNRSFTHFISFILILSLLLLLLVCITSTASSAKCELLLCMFWRISVCLSVCLCVGHGDEPCIIGWIDRDDVWRTDTRGPKEKCGRHLWNTIEQHVLGDNMGYSWNSMGLFSS